MGNEFTDFLQTAGLYDTIEVTQANLSSLKELLDGKVRLNLYCKECGQNSVFIMQPINGISPEHQLRGLCIPPFSFPPFPTEY